MKRYICIYKIPISLIVARPARDASAIPTAKHNFRSVKDLIYPEIYEFVRGYIDKSVQLEVK